ncbi:MAG: P-loop NTPase [Rhodospirillaceae bacterium]|nr:P-loop NTPase [Rhodospirillaceae bacterium]
MPAQAKAPTAKWKPGAGAAALAFVGDEETAATIGKCYADLALIDTRVERAGIDSAIATLAENRSPRLLIVDVSGLDDPVPKLRRLAEFCDPATAVVVLGDRNDVALYRSLKQLGVAEYFFKPLAPELLTRAFHAILVGGDEPAAGQLGKLVVVFGVRGGVGASTIAVNVAWHLAEDLNRHVALLDLDLEGGDAALQLNVNPGHALRDALEHPERVDDLMLERAIARASERLGVLASLEPLKEPLAPQEAAVMPLIEKLRARFRYVVVDLPHWAGPGFAELLDSANMLLLVADPSLAAIRDLMRWRETVAAAGPEHSVWQVLNKLGAPGALSEKAYREAFEHEPDAVVRFDSHVAHAANIGRPAMAKSRALMQGLTPLFKSLAGVDERPPSFLERLFGA